MTSERERRSGIRGGSALFHVVEFNSAAFLTFLPLTHPPPPPEKRLLYLFRVFISKASAWRPLTSAPAERSALSEGPHAVLDWTSAAGLRRSATQINDQMLSTLVQTINTQPQFVLYVYDPNASAHNLLPVSRTAAELQTRFSLLQTNRFERRVCDHVCSQFLCVVNVLTGFGGGASCHAPPRLPPVMPPLPRCCSLMFT